MLCFSVISTENQRMKNYHFLVLLLLALTQTASLRAQTYIGLGANLSSIYESDLALDHSLNSNPAFAIGYQFLKESRVKANTEMQYSVKGFKIKGANVTIGDPDGGGTMFLPRANSNLRIHYLDFIPTIEFPVLKNVNLVAGANGSVKLFDTYNDVQLQDFEMEKVRTFDCGWVIGTKISHKQYWLRAQLNKGLISASQDSKKSHFKNANFQILLGFLIDKKTDRN